MRATRFLLAAAGFALAAYGAWLLRPQLPYAWTWLVAGPVLHDAVVAPLVGLTGLALARLLPGRTWRRWVAAGLAVTGTLLLIATPLVWRPHRAPPNPGLQDRDYVRGLAIWLAVLWACVLLGAAASRLRARRARP
ncbi:hypothetical protein ACTMTJ_15365 [Phytohabitans sp. LJ34]|uniref:hypothetical protein n=1 Tax=Phytohabitans sp. LJ34 TaxID=3452217 RepID=UPI003F895BB0